jgi:hypothetical protein
MGGHTRMGYHVSAPRESRIFADLEFKHHRNDGRHFGVLHAHNSGRVSTLETSDIIIFYVI